MSRVQDRQDIKFEHQCYDFAWKHPGSNLTNIDLPHKKEAFEGDKVPQNLTRFIEEHNITKPYCNITATSKNMCIQVCGIE